MEFAETYGAEEGITASELRENPGIFLWIILHDIDDISYLVYQVMSSLRTSERIDTQYHISMPHSEISVTSRSRQIAL